MHTTIRQGEVRGFKIEALPEGLVPANLQRDKAGRIIVSHSETGNHHVLPAGTTVLERTTDVPAGMQILYALLDNPADLEQDAGSNNKHQTIALGEGTWELRIKREFSPFEEEIRRVAD